MAYLWKLAFAAGFGMLLALAGRPGAEARNVTFLAYNLGTSAYIDETNLLRGRLGGGRPDFTVKLVRAMMLETGELSLAREIPFAKHILCRTNVSNRTELLPGEPPGHGYIAFSRNVPDAEIERWQHAFDTLKAAGTFDQLKQEYIIGTSSMARAPCFPAGN